MDNVSQTSDYSSGSDRSSNGNHRMFHPTNFEGSYSSGIVHDRGFMGNQIQLRQNVNDPKRLPYCSQGSVNHQVLSRPNHLGSSDLNNQGMDNPQTKALVHENSRLKNEVVMLKKKCKKIQECENQFVELQSQYESLVKTTVRRQAYEQALRSRHSGAQHASRLVSSGTQTSHVISSREHEHEIISLKMMLREKEELILNLLREREHKAGSFCPDSLHGDYIAANVVSL